MQGAGLQNNDNTCFLNATLQCLIHTPPLAEVLLGKKQWAGPGPGNMLGATQQLTKSALEKRSRSLLPQQHIRALRALMPRCALWVAARPYRAACLAVDDDTFAQRAVRCRHGKLCRR